MRIHHHSRRLCALALTLCILFGLLPVPALAAGSEQQADREIYIEPSPSEAEAQSEARAAARAASGYLDYVNGDFTVKTNTAGVRSYFGPDKEGSGKPALMTLAALNTKTGGFDKYKVTYDWGTAFTQFTTTNTARWEETGRYRNSNIVYIPFQVDVKVPAYTEYTLDFRLGAGVQRNSKGEAGYYMEYFDWGPDGFPKDSELSSIQIMTGDTSQPSPDSHILKRASGNRLYSDKNSGPVSAYYDLAPVVYRNDTASEKTYTRYFGILAGVGRSGSLLSTYHHIMTVNGDVRIKYTANTLSAPETKEPVAKIGDTPYYTIGTAVTAFNYGSSNRTLTLLTSVNSNGAVRLDKPGTVDLNNCTWTATEFGCRNTTGTLEIKNGTLQAASNTNGYNFLAGSTDLTLNGVTVNGGNAQRGVHCNGTLTLTNCTITAEDHSMRPQKTCIINEGVTLSKPILSDNSNDTRLVFNSVPAAPYEIDAVIFGEKPRTLTSGFGSGDIAQYLKTAPSVSGLALDLDAASGEIVLRRYKVTFDASGGTVSGGAVQYVNANGKLSALPTATYGTKIFAGWYQDDADGNGAPVSRDTVFTGDATVTARWEAAPITVTFHNNDGSGTTTQKQVNGGGTYGVLPTPTRTGYTFDGWFTETNGGSEVTSETAVLDDVNALYAKWTPKEYTVTLDARGGTLAAETPTSFTYGEKYNLPTPTRDGFTFGGWFLRGADNTETAITAETTVSQASHHTVYAKWTGEEITVTLDPGEGTLENTSVNVNCGDKYNLPTPTREEYDFKGWYREESYRTLVDKTTVVEYGDKDITLYAKWEKSVYTVFFSYSGAKVGSGSNIKSYDSAKVTHGETVAQPIIGAAYSATGQKLKLSSWVYQKDGKSVAWDFKDPVTRNMTLSANWVTYPCKVYFYPNGGGLTVNGTEYNDTNIYTVSVASSSTIKNLPVPTTGDPEKVFAGWYPNREGTGDALTSGTAVNDDMSCYAKWVDKTYRVYFSYNGGTGPATADVTKNYTLPTPERTDYVFTGWKSGDETYAAGAEITLTGDIRLTAQWELKKFNVTLNANGGTIDEGTTKTVEVTCTQKYNLPTPTNAGAFFLGWYTEQTGGTRVSDTTTVTETDAATLYAHWVTRTTHVHSEENITFGEWQGSGELTLNGGSYFLKEDTTITESITITGEVNFCLNGHTLTYDRGDGSAVNAIVISDGATLNLYDCDGGSGGTIKRVTNTDTGKYARGVMVGDSGAFNMYGGVIKGFEVAGNGAGVYVSNNGTFNMHGGKISGNSARSSSNGGGVYVTGGAFNMYGGEISDNYAYFYGGGVYISGGEHTMKNAAISGNSAPSGSGGGVYVTGGKLTMENATVSGNSALIYGGGMYLNNTAITAGENVKITDNRTTTGAGDGGGGVCLAGETAITSSEKITISGNESRRYGGGMYLTRNGTYEIVNVEISGNKVTNSTDSSGGGVYVCNDVPSGSSSSTSSYNTSVTMEGVTINGNTAPAGGGVSVLSSTTDANSSNTFTIRNSTISDNTASAGDGGGIYSKGANNTGGKITLDMSNVEISGNTAVTGASGTGRGGGMYAGTYVTLAMDKAVISGNTSGSSGGGVYNDYGTFTVKGAEISGNTAGSSGGGGVYNNYGDFTVNGAEISGNTATRRGGGVYVTKGTFKMNGGTISGNTVPSSNNSNGGGVYVADGTTLTTTGLLTVRDNTVNGSANNVYLYLENNSSIVKSLIAPQDDGDVFEIDMGSSIGITCKGQGDLAFTRGYSLQNSADNPASVFTSDDPTRGIYEAENGSLKYLHLGEPGSVSGEEPGEETGEEPVTMPEPTEYYITLEDGALDENDQPAPLVLTYDKQTGTLSEPLPETAYGDHPGQIFKGWYDGETPVDGETAFTGNTILTPKWEACEHPAEELKVTPGTATCTEGGTTSYECTACGSEWTETTPALGHDFTGDWSLGEQEHSKTCKRTGCGVTVTETHDWVKKSEADVPNCAEGGSQQEECPVCGKTNTKQLAPTDHIWGPWTDDGDALHKRACTVCRTSETADHAWVEKEVTKAASCLEEGELTLECAICRKTAPVAIAALGHTFPDAWTSKDDTCHEHTCTVCGTATETEAHEWDIGTVTTEATDTEEGLLTYTCVACGNESKTEVIPALGSAARYTVTYDGGADDVTGGSTVGKNVGEKFNLPGNPFTRTGYAFTGWGVAVDGGYDYYGVGDEFTMPAENVIFTAQWELNLPHSLEPGERVTLPDGTEIKRDGDTVTITPPGVDPEIKPTVITVGPGGGVTIEEDTRTEETPDGGTEDVKRIVVEIPGGSTVQTGEGPAVEIPDNNPVKVELDGSIDGLPAGTKITDGDTTVTTDTDGGSVSSKGDLTFPDGEGRVTVEDEDGGGTITIPKAGEDEEPIVVTAARCTVTFDMQGYGTPIASVTVLPGTKIGRPEDPTEPDYVFDGWYLRYEESNLDKGEASEKEWDFANDAVFEDMTLYARWTGKDASARPQITRQPEGIDDLVEGKIPDGTKLTVEVEEPGNGDITYQWYEDDGDGAKPIAGATGPSYTIPKDTEAGTHTYYCEVTNTEPDKSPTTVDTNRVTVTVKNEETHEHRWSDWRSDEDCHWKECLDCGETTAETAHYYGDGEECVDCARAKPEAPHEHIWGAWEMVAEPTESEEGLASRECETDSSHKEEKGIPVLTDTSVWELTEETEPTEDEDGCKTYESDEYGTVTVVVPSTGHTHNWGEWKIKVEPTLTARGRAERECVDYSAHKDTRILPALTDTTVWTPGEPEGPDGDGLWHQTYTSDEYGSVTIVVDPVGPEPPAGDKAPLDPGETKEIDTDGDGEPDITVRRNDEGDTVTVEKDGEPDITITVPVPPAEDDVLVNTKTGEVEVPDGSTVNPGGGKPDITLPDGGTVDPGGGVTPEAGGSVEVGDVPSRITPPEGGKVTPNDDGTVTVPDGGTVKTGDDNPDITVPGGSEVDPDTGEITLPDGGKVTVKPGKDGGEDTITVPPGGVIKPDGTLKGEPEDKIAINTTTLPNGKEDEPYSGELSAAGSEPITWTADGLPDGLALDPASGEITGTPITPGTYHVTITATDSDGNKAETTLDIVIDPKSEPDGKAALEPGGKVTAENGVVVERSPDGGKVTIDRDGDGAPDVSIDIPVSGDVIADRQTGDVDVPGGSTVKPGGSAPDIRLPGGGTVDPDGGVTPGPGGSAVVDGGDGGITVTPPSGGDRTLTPNPDGTVEVPKGSELSGGGDKVTIIEDSPGTGDLDPSGVITFPDGGVVTVEKPAGSTPDIEIPEGGSISIGSDATDIDGEVRQQDESSVPDAEVTLVRGSELIQKTRTDANGRFYLFNIPRGAYNLVAKKNGQTATTFVNAEGVNLTSTLTMPSEGVNSELSVPTKPEEDEGNAAEISKTVIDNGLYEEAKLIKKEDHPNASTVTVTVTVERKQETDAVGADKIQALVSPIAKFQDFLEITITKDVDGERSNITETRELFTFLIPYSFAGKRNVTVYRHHNGTAAALTKISSSSGGYDGTFYLDESAGMIYIYSSSFSTLLIAAEDENDPVITPPAEPSTGSGPSGGPGAYPPVINGTEHGTVSVTPPAPGKNDRVTITPVPDPGYEAGTVTVTDGGNSVPVTDNGDGTYTFIQPSGSVTVTVTFRPSGGCPKDATCPIARFNDATPTAWYHDGVHYCVENGLFNGYGDGTFRPDDDVTRAQLAQILYNRAGRPEGSGGTSFTDVARGMWYTNAVDWAFGQGIVKGYSDGSFRPESSITREQFAVMLWRAAGSPASSEGLSFYDTGYISDYAEEAVRWAVSQGIIQGYTDGSFAPKRPATRAQAATMLARFVNSLG